MSSPSGHLCPTTYYSLSLLPLPQTPVDRTRRRQPQQRCRYAAARAVQTEEELLAARRDLDFQLRPCRSKMTAEQLAMLEKQCLERRLLESAGLRWLSLFYLQQRTHETRTGRCEGISPPPLACARGSVTHKTPNGHLRPSGSCLD